MLVLSSSVVLLLSFFVAHRYHRTRTPPPALYLGFPTFHDALYVFYYFIVYNVMRFIGIHPRSAAVNGRIIDLPCSRNAAITL